MFSGTTLLLSAVVVNAFVVLVIATQSVVKLADDDQLETLLATDNLIQFRKGHRTRTDHASVNTSVRDPRLPDTSRARTLTQAPSRLIHEELDFEFEDFLLPTEHDLRLHRRKRQVITEEGGSGTLDAGVDTKIVLDVAFSSGISATIKTDAETLVKAEFDEQGVDYSTVTAVVSDNGNSETSVVFTTKFNSVNNRVLVAYVFKNFISGFNIGAYTQTREPTVWNANNIEKTVTCYLCPSTRPCGSGTSCQASKYRAAIEGFKEGISTASSTDFFPWGFSTIDNKLSRGIDANSESRFIRSGFTFNTASKSYYSVGDNGILSFGTTLSDPAYNPPDLASIDTQPEDFICVFCADANLLYAGTSAEVFYGEYQVGDAGAFEILGRATNEVQVVDPTFEAMWVAVITWFDVPYFERTDKTTPSTLRNTFQAVLISDGIDSYVLINYKDMAWPQSFLDRSVIGYKHLTAGTLINYKQYKTDGDQRESVPMDLITGNTGQNGVFLLKVGELAVVEASRQAAFDCGSWYTTNYLLMSEFRQSLAKMVSCPCAEAHIKNYKSFNGPTTVGSLQCYELTKNKNKLDTQQCCYSNEVLDEATSHYLRFRSSDSAHQTQDIDPYDNCCVQNSMCQLFRDMRPGGVCDTTSSVSEANAAGDPHITTLDGFEYSFNGYGEYLLSEITNGNFTMVLQCRTVPAKTQTGDDSKATIFQAFGVSETTVGASYPAIFFVEMNVDRTKMIIFANGTDISALFDETDNYQKDCASLVVRKEAANKVSFYFTESGISIAISLNAQTLSIETNINTLYRGLAKGLMGNFDLDQTNDLVKKTGETIPSTSTERQIFEMGETWRVTEAESVLRYEAGLTYAAANNLSFVPVFLDEIDSATRTKAEEVCGGTTNKQCILDFAATGNQALAESTKALQVAAEAVRATLANSAPKLTGTAQVNAEVSKASSLSYSSTDAEGDTVRYIVVGTTPTGLNLNADSGAVVWTPASLDPVRIVLVSEDAKGLASNQIDVQINLCGVCNNGGTCDFTNTRSPTVANSPDTFKLAACKCTTGWGGTDCNTDKNGCETKPCGSLRNCTDVTPSVEVSSGKAFTCGPCPAGYQSDAANVKCEDENECQRSSSPCPANSNCANTVGSFTCTCISGYRKLTDGTCADIDECADRSDDCDQNCENIDASYTCSCLPGFILHSNQKTCAQQTAPPSCSGHGCAHICTEVNSAPTCFCRPGYKLAVDNKGCEDINECNLNLCSQTCVNSDGSFTCSCVDGFSLDADNRSCSKCIPPKWGPECGNTCQCQGRASGCDSVKGCQCVSGWSGVNCVTNVNECQVNPNICGSKQICVDNQGSYMCNCPTGYAKNGTDCIDINECSATVNPCPDNSQCVNLMGSYVCNCLLGYNKVAEKCEDINECSTGQAGCDQVCNNAPSSYNCGCNDGFVLNDDRKTCRKFGSDPCNGLGGCQDFCVMENGAPSCRCNRGYILASNNMACDDVNECEISSMNTCTDKTTCRNIPGGFNCSCPAGQKLQNDERSCIACDDNHWGLNCANECGCAPLGTASCDKTSGCVCHSGWTGDKCDQDKNECSTVTCQANSDCQNLPGSYQCRCRSGYSLSADNTTCDNINECANAGDNVCTQDCTDTDGDYTCLCRAGFVIEGKGNCNDIDECTLGTSGCSQNCRNTIGSVSCECFEGYTIDPTNTTLCIQGPGAVCSAPKNTTCQQNCRRQNGTDTCFCNPGYILNADGLNCDDIKECDETPQRCSQNCAELQGSFSCSCNDGYTLAADKSSCTACVAGTYGANCAQNCSCDAANSISCNATDGSCTCRTGWKGTTCTDDVAECTDTPAICGTNGVCNERNGSYACTCSAGFSRSGDTCIACDSKHFGADCTQSCACDFTRTTSCNPQNGTCTCNPEWTGSTCTDNVNECNNSSPVCTGSNEQCRDTQGSFECDCTRGYIKASNNTCVPCNVGFYGDGCSTQCDCVAGQFSSCNNLNGACTCSAGWNDTRCDNNINECLNTATPVCTGWKEVCRDTNGTHACDCETGYYKAPNNTCIVCDLGKYGYNCSLTCDCVANQFSSCNNINGQCTCNVGWNDTRCDNNINECLNTATPLCNVTFSTCRDTNGSYACDCNTGYTATGNTCEDVNECSSSNGNCSYECNNTPGSYFCSCPLGYTGTGNACTKVSETFGAYVRFNVDRSAAINQGPTSQAYKDLVVQIEAAINSVAKATIPSENYVPAKVYNLTIGSVIAYSDLNINPTATTNAESLAAAIVKALADGPTVTVGSTSFPVSGVTYKGQTIPASGNACDTLKILRTFASDEYCEVENGLPVVRKLPAQQLNVPLIVGLTVPITLVVIIILIILIYVCCCKNKPTPVRRFLVEERNNQAFRSAFSGNLPTKGNFGASRYMMYSPHTLSETASQDSGDNFRYGRPKVLEGRSDFQDMPGPDDRSYPYSSPRDGGAYPDTSRSNFSWENMFNVLEPTRNGPFEVPRPNVNSSPNRVYRNGRHRDSLA